MENALYLLFAAKNMESGHHSTTNVGYMNHGCPQDVRRFIVKKNAIIRSEAVAENTVDFFMISLLSVIEPCEEHGERPPQHCKRGIDEPYRLLAVVKIDKHNKPDYQYTAPYGKQ